MSLRMGDLHLLRVILTGETGMTTIERMLDTIDVGFRLADGRLGRNALRHRSQLLPRFGRARSAHENREPSIAVHPGPTHVYLGRSRGEAAPANALAGAYVDSERKAARCLRWPRANHQPCGACEVPGRECREQDHEDNLKYVKPGRCLVISRNAIRDNAIYEIPAFAFSTASSSGFCRDSIHAE